MPFSMLMPSLFIAIINMSCQPKPALAPAGDPSSVLASLPMGATVYNDELKKEVSLLDDLLQGRLDQKLISATKKSLMAGRMGQKAPDTRHQELASLLLTLPELIHSHEHLSDNKKRWYKAKFLFLRRRFIESSMLLSEVLKHEPSFSEARNWRARAIFFLGNPDQAVRELESIIKSTKETSPHSLEALYLIGAIIYESHDDNKKRLNLGLNSWRRYLKLAETNFELKNEIISGLAELEKRLLGPQKSALPFDPFAPSDALSPDKNAILTAFKKEELLLALELCEKSLRQAFDIDIAIIKARIFIKNGRIDEAGKLFDIIVAKNDRYAPAFHYRGMTFMMKGQTKDAIACWQKTIELDSKYALFHKLDQRVAIAMNMMGETPIATH